MKQCTLAKQLEQLVPVDWYAKGLVPQSPCKNEQSIGDPFAMHTFKTRVYRDMILTSERGAMSTDSHTSVAVQGKPQNPCMNQVQIPTVASKETHFIIPIRTAA